MLNLVILYLQQWYKRRRLEANCYVGEKFKDPVTHEDNCECTKADYEWYVPTASFPNLPCTLTFFSLNVIVTSTIFVKIMNVFLLDLNLFLLGYVMLTTRTRHTKARVGGGRYLVIHVRVVFRWMRRWIRSVRWVGFVFSFFSGES